MKLVLLLLVITLTLGVSRAYEASLIEDTDQTLEKAEETEDAIYKFLKPYCHGNEKCIVVTIFVSEVCSVPTNNGEVCQSDCQYLLDYLWRKVLVDKPDLDELRRYVPDSCIPEVEETKDVNGAKDVGGGIDIEAREKKDVDVIVDQAKAVQGTTDGDQIVDVDESDDSEKGDDINGDVEEHKSADADKDNQGENVEEPKIEVQGNEEAEETNVVDKVNDAVGHKDVDEVIHVGEPVEFEETKNVDKVDDGAGDKDVDEVIHVGEPVEFEETKNFDNVDDGVGDKDVDEVIHVGEPVEFEETKNVDKGIDDEEPERFDESNDVDQERNGLEPEHVEETNDSVRPEDLEDNEDSDKPICIDSPNFDENPIDGNQEIVIENDSEVEGKIDFDKGVKYRMFHIGFENDWDEGIHEGVVEWKYVDERRKLPFCEMEQEIGEEPIILKPGDILVQNCSQKESYLIGKIYSVCLPSGYVLKNSAKCLTNVDSVFKYMELKEKESKKNISDAKPPEVLESLVNGTKFLKEILDYLSPENKEDLDVFNNKTLLKAPEFLAQIAFSFQYIALKMNQSDWNYDEIMDVFETLEDVTNDLRVATNQFPDIFKLPFFHKDILKKKQSLLDTENSLRLFARKNTKNNLNMVRINCKAYDATEFLSHYVVNVIGTPPRRIAWEFEFDLKKYEKTLAKLLLVYSLRGSAVAVKCISLNPNKSYQNLLHYSSIMQFKMEILWKYVKRSVDYIKDHAMVEYMEKDLKNFVEIHKGNDNYYLVQELYPYLRQKYFFYDYALAAHDTVDLKQGEKFSQSIGRSWRCFRCIGYSNSGFYTRNFIDIGVNASIYIMYTHSTTAKPFEYEHVFELFTKYSNTSLESFTNTVVDIADNNKYIVNNALAVVPGLHFESNNFTSKVGNYYNVDGVNIILTT